MNKIYRKAKLVNPILTAVYRILKIVLLATAALTAQPTVSQTDQQSSCPGGRASGPVLRFSGLSPVKGDTPGLPGDPPDRPATNV
jgi:hypothetical protein